MICLACGWLMDDVTLTDMDVEKSGTSALLTNLKPSPQSISRARIRLSDVYSLTAFIRLHAVLGASVQASDFWKLSHRKFKLQLALLSSDSCTK